MDNLQWPFALEMSFSGNLHPLSYCVKYHPHYTATFEICFSCTSDTKNKRFILQYSLQLTPSFEKLRKFLRLTFTLIRRAIIVHLGSTWHKLRIVLILSDPQVLNYAKLKMHSHTTSEIKQSDGGNTCARHYKKPVSLS